MALFFSNRNKIYNKKKWMMKSTHCQYYTVIDSKLNQPDLPQWVRSFSEIASLLRFCRVSAACWPNLSRENANEVKASNWGSVEAVADLRQNWAFVLTAAGSAIPEPAKLARTRAESLVVDSSEPSSWNLLIQLCIKQWKTEYFANLQYLANEIWLWKLGNHLVSQNPN